MSRRRSNRKEAENNIIHLEHSWAANKRAMEEGPKRKHWTKHDLKNIRPLTPSQADVFEAFFSGQHICAHGSAGTGKTYVASYLALNEVLRSDTPQDKIIIVRSAVSTRDIGHLPGTMEEKCALYELPYMDIFADLVGRASTYQDMKDAGLVEFHITSFLRGNTWNDAIVIVDEIENMDFHELNTIMTRLGKNTRIILVGDLLQTDLRDGRKASNISGMPEALRVWETMNEFSVFKFNRHDIVRGPLVKSWIVACEDTLNMK